jgi:hypothetical protein
MMKTERAVKGSPTDLTGMSLVGNPHIPEKAPKIQLSDKINLSSDFREEYDAWLLKRFGSDRVVCMIDGKIVTNPANVAIFSNTK